MHISANLGFLFREHPLPDAIRQAKAQGFDAVECHWPYDVDPQDVRNALEETGLPMLSLNTRRGEVDAGEHGLSALPSREAEARAAIDEAIAYATAIGCETVHVMAGKAEGPEAFATFTRNLVYAADQAAPHGIGILIEPLNTGDAPGYFLTRIDAALAIVAETGSAVKIMFDCYHMAIMEGDVLAAFERARNHVGHVQFAAVPDRTEPHHGEIDYADLLPRIAAAGHGGYFGVEYKPASGDFRWLEKLKAL